MYAATLRGFSDLALGIIILTTGLAATLLAQFLRRLVERIVF